LGPNMSEEMSFEAQCNTGECGAPHWVILSVTILLHLFIIVNILLSIFFPIINLSEWEMSSASKQDSV
jgi:hypothetical protein